MEPGDDDALTLAISDIDRRLTSLSGTVAEISAKVLYDPVPNKVWNWQEFNDDQRAAALAKLKEWMSTTLVRYPRVFYELLPCWQRHDAAIDALTAAYGTWLLAHHGKSNFEQLAFWRVLGFRTCGLN
jgi:hypothetical protein